MLQCRGMSQNLENITVQGYVTTSRELSGLHDGCTQFMFHRHICGLVGHLPHKPLIFW